MKLTHQMLALSAAIGIAFTGFAFPSLGADPAGMDEREQAPAGYSGPVFEPNYDFPTNAAQEARPWEAIDYTTDEGATACMEAVLAYVLEGQDRTTWRVQANPVRQWYHMPWMGPGANGREFMHGLTSERRSRPGELGPAHTRCRQNWAVGFYNPTGALTLQRVWSPVAAGGQPNLANMTFAPGAVVAKLLYTEANETEVPLLAGAPSITANIHEDTNPNDTLCPNAATARRAPATLRLLQLDVAVRDPDATQTGWVFGTFVYDGRIPGADPWTKLRPVGVMWGNDHALVDGSGAEPTESIVLSDFGFGRDFGREGRMSGPVDNPVSACTSCHMTAQYPSAAPMTPPANAQWSIAQCWFRNLGPTQAFGRTPNASTPCGTPSQTPEVSLDYSLQMAVALRNHQIEANEMRVAWFGIPLFSRRASVDEIVRIDGVRSYPVSRDEYPPHR